MEMIERKILEKKYWWKPIWRYFNDERLLKSLRIFLYPTSLELSHLFYDKLVISLNIYYLLKDKWTFSKERIVFRVLPRWIRPLSKTSEQLFKISKAFSKGSITRKAQPWHFSVHLKTWGLLLAFWSHHN